MTYIEVHWEACFFRIPSEWLQITISNALLKFIPNYSIALLKIIYNNSIALLRHEQTHDNTNR